MSVSSNLLNIIVCFLLLICISCTTHEEVELPDINFKSPSYEAILMKKKFLEKQGKELQENKKEDL